MAFKRALWRSGLVYRRECDTCRLHIEYMDDKLDFRPWYPDGFVYCPRCQTPLRHSEKFAVTQPKPETASMISPDARAEQSAEKLCHRCGAKLPGDALFCSYCGIKLDH